MSVKTSSPKKNLKLAGLAAALLVSTGCAGEAVMLGTLVANPATYGLVAAMAPVTATTLATTKWYDGIEEFDDKREYYATLDRLSKSLSSELGVELTRADLELMITLWRRDTAGLREFAQDHELTREQVMAAIERLKAHQLISVEERITPSGPFVASLTPKGLRARRDVGMLLESDHVRSGGVRFSEPERVLLAAVVHPQPVN